MLEQMFELYENNPEAEVSEYITYRTTNIIS